MTGHPHLSRVAVGIASIAIAATGVVAAATHRAVPTIAAPRPGARAQPAAQAMASLSSVHFDMHLTTSGVLTSTVHVVSDIDIAGQRSRTVVDEGQLHLEEVRDHDTYFVRAGHADRWTRIDLDPTVMKLASAKLVLGQAQLALLEKVAGELTYSGRSKTDGAATLHYSGSPAWRQVFDSVSAAIFATEADAAMLEDNVDVGASTVDIQVDAQHHVRVEHLSVRVTTAPATLEITADVHFSQFDRPVAIDPPAASAIASTRHAGIPLEVSEIVNDVAEASLPPSG